MNTQIISIRSAFN